MASDEPSGGEGRWIEAGILLLVCLAVTLGYSLTQGNPLLWDEYYHLLAARSWADTGMLMTGDGAYTREAWFSITVGWLFRTFGESLFVARLPGALALTLWTVAVYLFTRGQAGRTAAWAASLAFCLSPVVLINAVMVRFYGVAGLLFWSGCVAAFLALEDRESLPQRVGLASASLILLFSVFEITRLGRLWNACLAVWLAGYVLFEVRKLRHRGLILTALALALGLVGVWVLRSEWLFTLWSYYRQIPGWSLDRGGDIRWYESLLRQDYPVLWALFPLATLFTLSRSPRSGSMATVVFGIGVVLLSFGGAKAERFLLPLLPFFFFLWGIGISEMLPGIHALCSRFFSLFRITPPRPWVTRGAVSSLLVLIIGFVLLQNPGITRVRHVLRDQAASFDRVPQGMGASPTAWEEIAHTLRPLMEDVDAVVTSNSVQTLYHLGNYDFEIHPTIIDEVRPPRDFGVDSRTGRPVISTLESLIEIMGSNSRGLVFGERWRWNHPTAGFTTEVTEFIQDNMEEVPLPPRLGVMAYRW